MHEFAPVSSRTPRSAIAERPVPRTLPTRIHQLAGNRAFGRLQPNLMVNQPGDAYEIEADRVTDHVMGMPKPPVQRECACGGTCADCGEQEESHLQRVTTSFAGAHGGNSCELAEAPATVGEVLSSSGEPLDAGTRATMEGRFGQDFGHVRIHRDSNALASARAVAARAYTVSNHVVFGEHQYAPTRSGRFHGGARWVSGSVQQWRVQVPGGSPGLS